MKFLDRNRFRNCIIAGIIMMLLFGCASVKEMNVSEKYEDSKSWFKEKWQAVGSKFSSSEDEDPTIKPQNQKSNFFVYETQWFYETLCGIAEWFTGDSENWKALASANPKVRPKRIAAGTMILIPARLIKNNKLPTEAFAAKHRIYYFEHRVRRNAVFDCKMVYGSLWELESDCSGKSGPQPESNCDWKYDLHSAGNDENQKPVAPQSGLQNPSRLFCAYSDKAGRKI